MRGKRGVRKSGPRGKRGGAEGSEQSEHSTTLQKGRLTREGPHRGGIIYRMEVRRTRATAGTQTQQWEGRRLGGGHPLLTTEDERSNSSDFSMESEKSARTTTRGASYCNKKDRSTKRIRESALLVEITSAKLTLFLRGESQETSKTTRGSCA